MQSFLGVAGVTSPLPSSHTYKGHDDEDVTFSIAFSPPSTPTPSRAEGIYSLTSPFVGSGAKTGQSGFAPKQEGDTLSLPAWKPGYVYSAHEGSRIFWVSLTQTSGVSPQLVVSAGLDDMLRVWDVSVEGIPRLRSEFGGSALGAMSAAHVVGNDPRCGLLTGVGSEGSVVWHDVEVGEVAGVFTLPESVVGACGPEAKATYALASGADGSSVFASAGSLGGGLVWDLRVGHPVLAVAPESEYACGAWDLVRAMDLSADGEILALGGEAAVHMYDLRSPLTPLFAEDAGHADFVDAVALDVAGGHLVSSGRDGVVRVWSPWSDSPSVPRTIRDSLLPEVEGEVVSTNLAVDPGQGLLVVPSAPGSLLMYDLDTPDQALRMAVHGDDGEEPADFVRVALNTHPDRTRDDIHAVTADLSGNLYLWYSVEDA